MSFPQRRACGLQARCCTEPPSLPPDGAARLALGTWGCSPFSAISGNASADTGGSCAHAVPPCSRTAGLRSAAGARPVFLGGCTGSHPIGVHGCHGSRPRPALGPQPRPGLCAGVSLRPHPRRGLGHLLTDTAGRACLRSPHFPVGLPVLSPLCRGCYCVPHGGPPSLVLQRAPPALRPAFSPRRRGASVPGRVRRSPRPRERALVTTPA